MTNHSLADDYLRRAIGRAKAIRVLFDEKLYADVVRECQEACELALKSVIRRAGHPVPHDHDVSGKLRSIRADLPPDVQPHVEEMAAISKSQRRDRELSFYGSEDVTPGEFYEISHAQKAMTELGQVLAIVAGKAPGA